MSRKLYPLLILVFLKAGTLSGQDPCGDTLYQYAYEYELPPLSMRFKTSKNGDIIAGGRGSGNDSRAVILKWNDRDDLEWIKKENNPDWSLWDVTPLSDGNWGYLKKHRDSTNWVELTKINPQGNFIWSRRFRLQTSFTFESQLVSLEKTNGFLLNAFHSLSQFDNAGNLVWSKTVSKGVFLGVVQRSDGMVLALTQEDSGKASLLLLNEQGNVLKQNTLDGLTLDAAIGALYALNNSACIIRIYDRNVARLIQVDANLVPRWTKEFTTNGLIADLVVSKNDELIFPFYEPDKIDALALDKDGAYLWALKLQGGQTGAGIISGGSYLDGWKIFISDVPQEAPTSVSVLKIPTTKLPEDCFFIPGTTPAFKSLKLTASAGTVVLNNFLVKEIPSATFTYSDVSSVRQTLCRVPNPVPIPQLDLGPDQWICANSMAVLRATAGFVRYRWLDGSTDSTFRVFSPGLYSVEAWDVCGNLHRDSVQVIQAAAIPELDLGPDTMLCKDSSLQLLGPSLADVQYRWSTGASTSAILVSQPGNYVLEITDEAGCKVTDSVRIEIEDCSQFAVYVPNVMSPNSAVNQQFRPFFHQKTELLSYQFQIYNRWGAMVFESRNQQESWDGTQKGERCAQAVYVWTLRVSYRENEKEKEAFKRGEVLLLH